MEDRSDGAVNTSGRITNLLAVVDDRLRAAVKPQVGASSSPLGVIAAPAAVLCGIFGATLLGAISYRRSARRITRTLEATAAPQPSVPEPSTGPGSPGGLAGPLHAPRATDFLTKGEIMYLFVVPGIGAASLAAVLGAFTRWTLQVDNVEDAVRQLKWLLGSGSRCSPCLKGKGWIFAKRMDGHSVSMAVSYVEFLSSLFGTPLSSARARSYSDETPQASYAPCSPVHWAGITETECGQGHFEHSREDKETAFPPAPTAPTVKIARSTSD